MGDVKAMIPSWTKEDYTSIDNPAPYEWLYGKKDDKFIFMQYRGLIAEAAGAVGVKNFIKRYTEYANAQSVKRGEKLENVTMFDGQPCELLCGEYVCDDSGVTTHGKFGDEIVVCEHPIMPVQRLVNIDSGEIKLEVAYKRRGRWVRKIFALLRVEPFHSPVEKIFTNHGRNRFRAKRLVRADSFIVRHANSPLLSYQYHTAFVRVCQYVFEIIFSRRIVPPACRFPAAQIAGLWLRFS